MPHEQSTRGRVHTASTPPDGAGIASAMGSTGFALAPTMTSTVYYNGQFWVVILEVEDDGVVRAAQEVLGAAEPPDALLYQWFATYGGALMDRALASPPVAADARRRRAKNPKRAAREASREARQARPSTASQEAIRAGIEAHAAQRDSESRQRREAEAQERYRRRRERARQRHRGH